MLNCDVDPMENFSCPDAPVILENPWKTLHMSSCVLNYFRLYFCIDVLISNTYCFDHHLFNLLIFSAIYISVFSYFLNRGLNKQTDRMAAWLCVVWRHLRRKKIRLQRSEKLLWLKHLYSLLSRLHLFHGLVSRSFLGPLLLTWFNFNPSMDK